MESILALFELIMVMLNFWGNQSQVMLLLALMVKLTITTLILNPVPGINYQQGLIQNGHHGITAMALPGKMFFVFITTSRSRKRFICSEVNSFRS